MRSSSSARRRRLFAVLATFSLLLALFAPLMPAQFALAQIAPDEGLCTVTSDGDSGDGTLRQAVGNIDCEEIVFAASIADIVLTSDQLPAIERQLEIRGPEGGNVTIRRSDVDGTDAFRIFRIDAGGDVTLANLTISNGLSPEMGFSTDHGGGILNLGKLLIINSAISGNNASVAGGIRNLDGAAELTIVNSTISGNDADSMFGGGGGIYNTGGGQVTITGSTLSGNTTTGDGGAVYSTGPGPVMVTNSTISNNSAGTGGGGIFSTGNGSAVEVVSSTIVANATGGVHAFNSAIITLTATIVTGSNPSTLCTAASGGSNTGTNNVALTGSSCPIASGSGSDLFLGPLAYNGGPTQTHLPLVGSPAIGGIVDCQDLIENEVLPDIDQRGVERPQGGTACDVGAVEVHDPAENETWVVTNLNDDGPGSLRRTVNHSLPGATITFDMEAGIVEPYAIQLTSGQLEINKQLTIQGPNADGTPIEVRGNNHVTGNVSLPSFRVLEVGSSGVVHLSGLTISGGRVDEPVQADSNGGGIANFGGSLTITNSVISGNYAPWDGGGVYNVSGIAVIADSRVSGNTAGNGGGLYNRGLGSKMTVSNVTIINNEASVSNAGRQGGGIFVYGGEVSVTDTTIAGNTAVSIGGGIFVDDPLSDLTIENTTISGNSGGPAGGIRQFNGTTLIKSSTISRNGDAIFNQISIGVGSFSLMATIVDGNCGSTGSGSIESLGYNLFVNGSNCPTDGTGDIVQLPGLEDLGNNGGPTLTMLPGESSPALNKIPAEFCSANLLPADQRGIPRPQGTNCDIGAVERSFFDGLPDQDVYVVTSNADPVDTNPDLVTLRQVVEAAPNGATITFDIPGDPGVPRIIQLTTGQLTINRELTIQGPNADGSPIQVRGSLGLADPDDHFRVFAIGSHGQVAISDLEITLGYALGNLANADDRGHTGGGIYNGGGDVTITSSTISNNDARLQGGGIANYNGKMEIVDSTISGNHALGYQPLGALGSGGGIRNDDGGELTITGSSILNNRAVLGGGGGAHLSHFSSSMDIINSTISGNSAGQGGRGGIYATPGANPAAPGPVTLTSSTVAGNTGHGIDGFTATFTLIATIVADTCGTPVFSGGFNIVSDAGCISGAGEVGDVIGEDPLLSRLGHYGGPTQTYMPLAGSPAINGIENCELISPALPDTDQRGVARPQGGAACDIGAVEVQPSPVAETWVVTNLNDDGPGSLRRAVNHSFPGATITFDVEAGIAQPYDIQLTSGDLIINKTLTINGPNVDEAPITVLGNNLYRVFTIGPSAVVEITALTISGGGSGSTLAAGGNGGGIVNTGGILTIRGSTISGNITNLATTGGAGDGGGIANTDGGTLIVESSTISGNTALVFGGGIFISGVGSTAEITNSTIIGNSVNPDPNSIGFGGGIHAGIDTSLTIVSSTIHDNSAYESSGIFGAGDVTLTASIVVSSGPDSVCSRIFDGTNNLTNVASGCFSSGDSNLHGTDPELGPLTDNGGPTLTHAPLFDSPAIGGVTGAGICPATDQRGIGRPAVGCTIGAVEYTNDVVVRNTHDDGVYSLRWAITATAPGGTITFDMDDETYDNIIVGDTHVITLTSGQLEINKALTITGSGADLLTVRRAEGADKFRIFEIGSSGDVSISGLTITGGDVSGLEPEANRRGGGIRNQGTLEIADSVISGNQAGVGGGIANIANTTGQIAALIIIDSTVDGNSATTGGGIYNTRMTAGTAQVTITGSTISGNSAVGSSGTGGGIHSSGGLSDSIVVIENSTISGNTAESTNTPSSGIHLAGATLTMIGSTLVTDQAGAILVYSNGSTMNVTATLLVGSCTSSIPVLGGTNNRASDASCLLGESDTNLHIPGLAGMLDALEYNGGPTGTHLPTANSTGIVDQVACAVLGTAASSDQRGANRPSVDEELCDIGAVEVQLPVFGDVPTDFWLTAPGPAGIAGGYTLPIATDWLENTIVVTCDPAPGTLLGVGEHPVICSTSGASDHDINQVELFTITVEIPDAPTMEQPGNISETSGSPSGLVVEFDDPEAEDFNGDPLDVSCEPLSGTLFPLGTTPVTCTSEADVFDRTVVRTFTVTIQPAQSLAPTFGATPGSVIPTSNPDGTAVTFVPNVSSQIDDNPTVVCTPPSGTFFSIGTHTITCTVTDKYGLSSSMSFQLTIVFDDGSSPTPPTPPTPPVDPEPEEPTEPEEPQEPTEPEAPVGDPSAFDDVWARTDLPVANGDVNRTWVWGPAPFSTLQEVPTELWEDYAESPDGKRLVRYYDKARMEITDPDAPDSGWFVTNGLLVVELISGKMQVGDNEFIERTPADVVIAGDLDDPNSPTYADLADLLDPVESRVGETITERLNGEGSLGWDVSYVYFDEVTGHNIAAPFWEFMNSTGLVWVDGNLTEDLLFENPFYGTGRPVTEAYWVTVNVGGTPHEVLLQCFERRCLTYTPENPDGWQVEAGNVGLHYFIWRYGE